MTVFPTVFSFTEFSSDFDDRPPVRLRSHRSCVWRRPMAKFGNTRLHLDKRAGSEDTEKDTRSTWAIAIAAVSRFARFFLRRRRHWSSPRPTRESARPSARTTTTTTTTTTTAKRKELGRKLGKTQGGNGKHQLVTPMKSIPHWGKLGNTVE